MKDSKIIPENINLFHINILESDITDSLKPDNLNFDLNVAHNILHNLKDERVKIGLILNIKSKSSDNEFKALFNIDFHYKIKDLNHFYEVEEDANIVFSGMFISTLIGISFSTARGIIYQRLAATNMKNIILPVVSPSKILFSKKN